MDKLLIGGLKFWSGKQQLSKAFWAFFLPIYIICQALKALAKGGEDPVVATLILFIIVALKIYSIVGLWRCAPNTKVPDSPTKFLARFVCVISAMPLPLLLIPFSV